MSNDKPFRESVVGLIVNDDCKVLAIERSDVHGAWQFPQGGIEEGESAAEAVLREVAEELGLTTEEISIVTRLDGVFEYEFPSWLEGRAGIAKKFRGQRLRAFVLKLKANAKPNLKNADGEVKAVRWADPEEVLPTVAEFKQEAYTELIKAFRRWADSTCKGQR